MNEYLKKVKAEWLAKSNVTPSANEELISVIIPLYNQGRFLEETILSVINQTYKNWEIVIVNDCSTDDSLEIAQRLCQKYSSFAISVHSNSVNSGVSATRNNAIRQSRGKYFIPLDSDDKIAPTFMQKCMQTMLESGADIVYVDVQEFGEQNNMVPSVEFDPVRLLFMNYIAICSLVKKAVWEKVGGYEEHLEYCVEDWNFWINAVKKGFVAKHLSEPLFHYRKHAASAYSALMKENENLPKSIIVLANRDVYYAKQIVWAEEIQKGNPEYLNLKTQLGVMPIFDAPEIAIENVRKRLHSVINPPALPQVADIQSVAIFNWGLIGDNVAYLGMLPPLKKHYSNAKIYIICRQHCKVIYENNTFVDEVICPDVNWPKDVTEIGQTTLFLEHVAKLEFDLFLNINPYARNSYYDALSTSISSKFRIGWDFTYEYIIEEVQKDNAKYDSLIPYQKLNRDYNLVERVVVFLRHLHIAADYYNSMPILKLIKNNENFADNIFNKYQISPEKTICFAVQGSGFGASKNYDKFDKVLEYITDKYDYNIMILGEEKDFLYANDLTGVSKANIINLCGQTTILQAAAIISKSRMIVGVDTGLLHIACAVNTPNVVIMPSFVIGVQFPYSNLTSAIYLPTNCANCINRCKYNETICLQRISYKSVNYVIDYTLNNELVRPRVFLECENIDVTPAEYKRLAEYNFSDYVEVIRL